MATNLFVSLYHFFFVFHDVGYTQKIKKDERDFISFFSLATFILVLLCLAGQLHINDHLVCVCVFFFC